MDSLLLLCARRIVAHRPIPAVPTHLYPVLFQAAFLDGRPLALQDLVSTWPFPELNCQRLVGSQALVQGHLYELCVPAVIQAVVTQLRQDVEEPGRDSRCRLRLLDMTGLPDHWSIWSGTVALAKACMEVSKHLWEFQRRGCNQHKGPSRATPAAATPRTPGVDVHANLFVIGRSYGIVQGALQTGAASPLRLKCREFHAEQLTASEIVSLLESLDPSCVRRVSLCYYKLAESSVILPHLSRFPELRSLRLQDSDIDVWRPMPDFTIGIQCLARPLGMLPGLRELSLRSSDIFGNLCQILCDLQAPLESLELASCSLLPADLTFLSQSFHARALKRLDLSDHDFSQQLLEPLRLLLEETSASLLHLELMECRMADSHLKVLLPTIRRCSHLRFLGLHGNSLSMAALKDLLQKTLELPDLRLVVYPIPVDLDNPQPPPLEDDLEAPTEDCLEYLVANNPLDVVCAEISQMLANSGRTDLVWTYISPYRDVALDYFSL